MRSAIGNMGSGDVLAMSDSLNAEAVSRDA